MARADPKRPPSPPAAADGTAGALSAEPTSDLAGAAEPIIDLAGAAEPINDLAGPPAEAHPFRGVRLVWLGLCLASIASMHACVSQVEPFFPSVAQERFNATNFSVGVVIAVMPASVAVTGMAFGLALTCFSHFAILMFGLAVLSTSTAVFPFCGSMLEVGVVRVFQGVGSAAVLTPAYALNTMLFSTHMSTVAGFIEMSIGLGYMLGPAVGGILFHLGGYELPFLVLSGANVTLGILFVFLYSQIRHDLKSHTDDAMSELSCDSESAGPGSGSSWLLKPTVIVHSCSAVFMSTSYGLLGAVLAPELQASLGVGPLATGFVFSVGALVYVPCAPLAGYLADTVTGNRPIVFVGFLLAGLSLLLVGPAPVFPDPGVEFQWGFKLSGMIFLGLGVAGSIPVLPDIIRGEGGRRGAEDQASALFTVAFSIGEIIGPAVGGLLTQLLGFRGACGAAGTGLAAWSVLLFALGLAQVLPWQTESPAMRRWYGCLKVLDRKQQPQYSPADTPAGLDSAAPLLTSSVVQQL